MIKISTSQGLEFVQQHGQSILDASIEAGYPILHSCRSGRCGLCKAKLLAGDTQCYRREELPAALCQDQWILTCSRTALSDVQLELGAGQPMPLAKAVKLPCVIRQLSEKGPYLLLVNLQLPLVCRTRYQPGQRLCVLNAAGLSGTYQVAAVLPEQRQIQLQLARHADSALQHYWFAEAQMDDVLTLLGPLAPVPEAAADAD
ncbi:2Fe-2S iron-sulfur cluster-binding protein [Rheinheimera sp.]|uniref:2Fe-2S iron-sulfur cluster-binding protein n=1 Tax=Rheinheimera sp. TaxID=1869214 RepID=UPI00307E7659